MFQSKTERMNIKIEFDMLQLVYVSNLTLSNQFRVFELNLLKQAISGRKQKKMNIPKEFCILALV